MGLTEVNKAGKIPFSFWLDPREGREEAATNM
jgi:hypothetical protein